MSSHAFDSRHSHCTAFLLNIILAFRCSNSKPIFSQSKWLYKISTIYTEYTSLGIIRIIKKKNILFGNSQK